MPVIEPASVTTEQLRWARVLFETASAEHGEAREAVLSQGCSGDLQVRALVARMLDAEGEVHPILDRPLSLVKPDDSLDAWSLKPGAVVGRYRIVREIASGGMGGVYQAELAEGPPQQLFAIKVVRWLSDELSRRFQQEQTILSGLQHPNIARFLDSGTTADGHPYFVMEYIEGQPIHAYCDRNGLTTDGRIRLFREVCAAVSYLHQNLVVHRDLKPGNILVTAAGTVKLVDFGIAKPLQPPGSVSSPVKTGAGLMTPEYASPEQIQGGPISTRTDVYTLGTLLFELLTGAKPFAAPGKEVYETLRRICSEEPPRPSVVVSQGQLDPASRRKLSRKLRGELDNIVLQAIRKEPERRYPSVEQFDEDLWCYLNGLPVPAQGDSAPYRVRKFVRRHKAAVAAAVAMVVLLAGGIVATSIQAGIARREKVLADQQRAEAERQRARAEQQAAEAERQRANAERRLAKILELARGAAGVYASSRASSVLPGDAAMIAEHTQRSLEALDMEGILDPGLASMLDATSLEIHSHQLAVDETWRVPAGWLAEQSVPHEYRVGVDQRIAHGGKSSLFLLSLVREPTGSVAASQVIDASRYRGKRLRLTSFLRSDRIVQRATLWLRMYVGDEIVAWDRSPVSGTTPWREHRLVMDVPRGTTKIEFGLYMVGTGALWADDFSFELVPLSVPLRGRLQPKNLSFAEKND